MKKKVLEDAVNELLDYASAIYAFLLEALLIEEDDFVLLA